MSIDFASQHPPRNQSLMPAVLRCVLPLLLIAFACPNAGVAQSRAPLTRLSEVLSLSRDHANQQRPLQVSGVVTFAEPKWHSLYIQDGESVAFVEIADPTMLSADVKSGDVVEITGTTHAGSFTPLIKLDGIRRLRSGELPVPARLQSAEDFTARNWKRFVEFEGTVYDVYFDEGHMYLHLAASELAVYAVIRVRQQPPGDAAWRGQVVRVRGALAVPQNEDEPPTIVTEQSQVEFLVPEAQRKAAVPFQEIASLRWTKSAPEGEASLRVIAQAISDSRSTDFLLRDSTGALLVVAQPLPEIHVGDVVILSGSVTGERHGLLTLDGDVSRVSRGKHIVPVDVPAAEATQHPYEYVSVSGEFRGFAHHAGKRFPVLREDDAIFSISGPPDSLAVFEKLSDKSHIRVTGVCWPKHGQKYDFEILLNQAEIVYEPPQPRVDDFVAGPQIGIPPGIHPRRNEHPPGPGPIGPFIVASVASFLLLVLLVAFLVLLRRTKEQQKFYGAIHEQLNEVSHVSRLNTLAEMVGAFAHELNQPLTSVSNFAETARIVSQRCETSTPQLNDLLQRISSESHRAGEIIRRLRSLVQRKTPGRVLTSINQVVSDSLDMFRLQELVANGTLETHLEENLPRTEVDPIQLQQVILNLLLNARDTTIGLEDRLPKIVITTARDGDRLTISVEDNGSGIASGNPATIFEPYFTTKSEGMGLGLAICRTIVESHNGTIRASNLEPCGARLTVSLPIASQNSATTVR
ncbi:hypothetical protein GC176_21140 [bacterium]|nr:hypothetical protein [bacterium]